MKPHRLLCCLLLSLVLTASTEVFAQSNARQLNVDGITKAIGKEGDLTGEMYKVSFPRSDLTVKAGNLVIKPALALVNWAAFIKSDSTAITYGDLVLLDDEINPANSKLEDNGIELSALHTSAPRESSGHVHPFRRTRRRGGDGERNSRGAGGHEDPLVPDNFRP